MSVQIPTTQSVADDVVAQLEFTIAQQIPLLPKSFTRVLAKAIAGVDVILFRYCGFIFLQLFAATASMKETIVNGRSIRPLVEIGRRIGVGDPNPAVRAEHVIEITVKNQTGSLKAGTQLIHAATGVIHTTIAAVDLDDATVTVTVRASSDQSGGDGSGDIGNLEAGDTLDFANPQSNVASTATVLSQLVTGADGEKESAYRARVIRRERQKPQGGAYADYRIWAEGVTGIVHAYPYTGDPGEVDVYVEATPESSGSADGIPTLAQRNAVSDAIELEVSGLATRRPVNAGVNVLAITRTAFDVELGGLDVEDEDTVLAAIQAGVDEHLRSKEPFIVGLSVLPREDIVTRAGVGAIIDGIVSAYGGTIATVVVKRAGAPIEAYALGTSARGEKAKFGQFL